MGYKQGSVLRTAFETYELQRPRGTSGSGEVFEALDSEGAVRAVKILSPAKTGPAGLKRSANEFNFCFRSVHRNIIPVLDCGRTGPRAVFYVMPLYTASLRELVRHGIPPENVLRIFGNILDGMEAAHLHQVSHRDLKPENILTNDNGREVVVSDFGMAHFLEQDLIAPERSTNGNEKRLEELPYTAPEQRVRGNNIDEKADVYALGLILHEMFTGEAVIGLGHPDIADVAPDFAYLDWTVGRMTNPEPARRLSITEVKRELIARGNEFLSIQRLNALKTQVIRETDVDDPFVANPITIQSVDFKAETLYLTLSAAPPPNWVMAFHNSDLRSGYAGHGPDRFVFLGRLAQLRVTRGHDLQKVLDSAKSFIEHANRLYAEIAVAAHRENLEHERKKRHAQIVAEERRYQVLARLRL